MLVYNVAVTVPDIFLFYFFMFDLVYSLVSSFCFVFAVLFPPEKPWTKFYSKNKLFP